MDIKQLSENIIEVHKQFQQRAASAVNISLTLRNWFIGYYIVEYEQNGEDRAKYGAEIIKTLSKLLKNKKLKGISHSYLNVYRNFYLIYPQIVQALPEQLNKGIIQAVSGQFKNRIIQALPAKFQNTDLQNNTTYKYLIPPEKTLKRLSFTHITELIKISNPLKRAFYEIECINGTWSTRELERQINSLYYERSGLSENKEKLSQLANKNADTLMPADIIKNPMTFEFLDLPVKYLLEENQLEKALIDNMQDFMLELGNGFCFEARQKRILIDDEYFFIDLVFYHRILNCHVLIEIKTEKFTHENIGQLNVYLQYYKHEIMRKTDNPPVGILLCTKSKENMVKYATASDKQLFVNEYRLNLPSEEEIQTYIETKI